jgi:hypothetical protein
MPADELVELHRRGELVAELQGHGRRQAQVLALLGVLSEDGHEAARHKQKHVLHDEQSSVAGFAEGAPQWLI